MSDDDLRYGFSCPSCAGTFSISLAKIPPVQARFNCPKCGKAMDFPSREEARVYISLQSGGAPTPAAAVSEQEPAPPLREPARPTPPPREPARPMPPPPAAGSETMDATGAKSDKSYRLQKRGYETDVFDRRAMRTLIRTQLVNEGDLIAAGDAVAARADSIATGRGRW